MNEPTRDEEFDRQISQFLARHAADVNDAPSATEMSARLTAGRAATTRAGLGIMPPLAWVILAGLLVLSLIGAMVVGASLIREEPVAIVVPTATPLAAMPAPTEGVTPPTTGSGYEAVLVRWEEQTERWSTDVDLVVVAVDREGEERPLTRLVDAGVSHLSGLFYPRAAVSSTGLLVHPVAIPHGGPLSGPRFYEWQIVDLANPSAAPKVVEGVEPDTDQMVSAPYLVSGYTPGAFWGPGDQLAIPWYVRSGGSAHYRLTFVDGRTGDTRTVAVPYDKAILPHWAADGSGVIIADAAAAENFQVLRPDGSVVDTSASDAMDLCATKVTDTLPDPTWDGEAIECLAPDESFLLVDGVRGTAPVAGDPRPRKWVRITPSDTDALFEVEGSFAGWLEVTP